MKFLVVFAAIAAVAVGVHFPTTWTLDDISLALQNPDTNPALVPYLEEALNDMMHALMTGQPVQAVSLTLPSVTTYNLHELSELIQDPNTDPAHLPYYEAALNELMTAMFAGQHVGSITVVIPPPKPEAVPVKPADVAPAPAPAPAPASGPLVQIVVNVQQQQEQLTPEPVHFDPLARNQ